MTTTTQPAGVVWVCVDCYLAHHGYSRDELPHHLDREPWGEWDDTEVTPGLVCEHVAAGEYGECECDTDTFSWRECPACGTRLGGERHAFTYWL